jgi:hypothetical protein
MNRNRKIALLLQAEYHMCVLIISDFSLDFGTKKKKKKKKAFDLNDLEENLPEPVSLFRDFY